MDLGIKDHSIKVIKWGFKENLVLSLLVLFALANLIVSVLIFTNP
jgi:hypothetical protein